MHDAFEGGPESRTTRLEKDRQRMHDAFEGGPKSRTTRLEKDRQRMHEQSSSAKKTLLGRLTFFDITIALFLILAPLYMLGGYYHILYIPVLCGIAFIVVQLLLTKGSDSAAKRAGRVAARVTGVVLALCWLAVIYPYSGIKALYAPRLGLSLYSDYDGSRSDGRFMLFPQELPEKTDSLSMEFIPHGMGGTRKGCIKISFVTDEAGMNELRDNAKRVFDYEYHTWFAPDMSSDYYKGLIERHRALIGTDTASDSEEWYIFSELDLNNDAKFCYIDAATGSCIIYWLE